MGSRWSPDRHRAGPEKDANRYRSAEVRGETGIIVPVHGADPAPYPDEMTARSLLHALAQGARGLASTIVVVATVGVMVFLLAGRDGTAAPAATPGAMAAVGASAAVGQAPSPGASAAAVPSTASESPSSAITPAPEPSVEPTPPPTPAPTPKPTLKPTPKPTPKPIRDPAPEPTPIAYRASGSFGETLSAGGVTAFVQRRDLGPNAVNCGTDDPEWQGYTEPVSFTLRMTWSKPSEALEPFVAAGSAPYFYVVGWDDGPFKIGADNTVTVCVRPGDSAKVRVETESNGGPPRSYRFSFS